MYLACIKSLIHPLSSGVCVCVCVCVLVHVKRERERERERNWPLRDNEINAKHVFLKIMIG